MPKRIVIVVFIAGLALRVVAMLTLNVIPSGDPQTYLGLANSLASGNGFVRFAGTLGITVYAWQPPLYPALLALGQVALINTLTQLAGSAALLWLARACKLYKVVGIAAAACYFVLPFNILNVAIPHKEGLVAALAVGCAAAAIERRALPFGIFAALLALSQPALASLPLFFALVFLPVPRWPVAALAAIAVMLPWWVRNWLVLNSFVPLTSSGGAAFWIGVFGNGNDWRPLPSHLLVGNELAISRAAAAEAWQWVAAHPVDYLAKCIAKTLLVFWGQPLALLLLLAPLVRGKLGLLAALCLAQIFAFQMWFEMGTRHLFFLLPFALLIGMAGVVRRPLVALDPAARHVPAIH